MTNSSASLQSLTEFWTCNSEQFNRRIRTLGRSLEVNWTGLDLGVDVSPEDIASFLGRATR